MIMVKSDLTLLHPRLLLTNLHLSIVGIHFVVCNADEGGLDISSSRSAAGRNAWPVSQHVSLCTKLVIVILALCRTWFAHHKTLA